MPPFCFVIVPVIVSFHPSFICLFILAPLVQFWMFLRSVQCGCDGMGEPVLLFFFSEARSPNQTRVDVFHYFHSSSIMLPISRRSDT